MWTMFQVNILTSGNNAQLCFQNLRKRDHQSAGSSFITSYDFRQTEIQKCLVGSLKLKFDRRAIFIREIMTNRGFSNRFFIFKGISCFRPKNLSLENHLDSTDQNNNITMTSEDLLQPGHVVKERWKVSKWYFYFVHFLLLAQLF